MSKGVTHCCKIVCLTCLTFGESACDGCGQSAASFVSSEGMNTRPSEESKRYRIPLLIRLVQHVNNKTGSDGSDRRAENCRIFGFGQTNIVNCAIPECARLFYKVLQTYLEMTTFQKNSINIIR